MCDRMRKKVDRSPYQNSGESHSPLGWSVANPPHHKWNWLRKRVICTCNNRARIFWHDDKRMTDKWGDDATHETSKSGLLFSLSASVSVIWQTRGKSQVQATRLHCCRRYVRWNLDLSVHAKKEKPQCGREIPTEKSWVSDSRVDLLSDLLLLVAKHFNRTQNLNSTEINTQNIFFSTQNSSFSTTSAKAAVP